MAPVVASWTILNGPWSIEYSTTGMEEVGQPRFAQPSTTSPNVVVPFTSALRYAPGIVASILTVEFVSIRFHTYGAKNRLESPQLMNFSKAPLSVSGAPYTVSVADKSPAAHMAELMNRSTLTLKSIRDSRVFIYRSRLVT